MSGETAAMEAAASAAPEPEPAPEPDAPAHAFESVDDAVAELGKVREEAAGWRTKYAPFRDTFDGLDEGTVTFVLEAVRDLKSDNPDGVTKWLDLGAKMARDDEFDAWISGKVPAAEPAPETEGEPETVDVQATVAQAVAEALAKEREEREQQTREQETQRRAAELQNQAKELGYTPGTGPYSALFDVAMRDGVDLATASETLRAEFTGGKEAPRVPGTASAQAQGGVVTPEATKKLSAAEKLASRLDKVEQGIPG